MYLKMVNAMAKNPLDFKYIENGLIFHLDGINTGPITGYWTDLIGGIAFRITNGVGRANNGFVFPESSSAVYLLGTDKVNLIATDDTLTLEIVMTAGTSGTRYIFSGGSGTDIALVMSGGSLTVRENRKTRFVTTNSVNLSTYSINNYYALQNLTELTSYGTDYWQGPTGNAVVGGWRTDRQFVGTICDIRIYNRVLTKDEIRANQQIDIIRYGIQV